MTQTKLARAAGISDAFLSQILSGVRRPGRITAKVLAEATGTTPELWLYSEPDEIRAAIFAAPEKEIKETTK